MAEKHNEKCIYCNRGLNAEEIAQDFQLLPGAATPLYSCSQNCLDKGIAFYESHKKVERKFYGILFICTVILLVSIGFKLTTFWTYIPLIIIGITLFALPFPFKHYYSYMAFGIRRSTIIIKGIGIAVALAGAVFTMTFL